MKTKPVNLKTIRVSDETHAKILDCGKLGETLDTVMTRIVDYYRANALTKK